MASNAPMFFLLAVLCLLATANLAHGQLIPPGFITVNGSLCCTPTGACPGSPLANQTVSVVCPNLFGGGNSTVAVAVTALNGTFSIPIPIPNALSIVTNVLLCKVVVQLPLSSTVCPVLSTVTGTLSSVIGLLNLIPGVLSGLLGTATATGFGIGV